MPFAQLTYLLPTDGERFNPIGLNARRNDEGDTVASFDRTYNNRLAGGTFDGIDVGAFSSFESYRFIPNRLLINPPPLNTDPATGLNATWARNGLMRFINVMKSVDIYLADGTYEKGWLFGAQTIKQSPDHDYTPTTGIQPLFASLAKRKPLPL